MSKKYLLPLLLTTTCLHAAGLYQDFTELSSIQKENYLAKVKSLKSAFISNKDLAKTKSISLNPDFVSAVTFNSPSRYFMLGQKDNCSLYDLMSANLLKEPGKNFLDNVIIDFDQEGKKESYLLTKERFLEKVAYKKCPGSEKLAQYFLIKNLRKTFSNMRFKTPSSKEGCFEIHKELKSDVQAPFMCQSLESVRQLTQNQKLLNATKSRRYQKYLNDEVTRGKTLKKIIKENSLDYIGSFCLNIEAPELFCKPFFEESYWVSLDAEKNRALLDVYCKKFFKRKKLSKAQLKACVKKINNLPTTCHYSNDHNALQPAPNCKLISQALIYSNTPMSHPDCPGRTGHHGVTNFSRLLLHFNPELASQENCRINATYPMAKFDKDNTESSNWGIKVCYDDPIKKEEVCYPTIIEDAPDKDLSLSYNVARILERLRGFDKKNQECRILKEKEYKPLLLEYKSGCFIIKKQEGCLDTKCEFDVIYDEKKFTNIKFKTELYFDLFPLMYADENKSMSKMYKRFTQKEDRPIKSVSGIKLLYKNHPNAIMWGIGCKEDLLPTFFKQQHYGECTPIPFIADGMAEDKSYYSLVIRTSLDHVSAPRLVPWSYVYSAVKRYQEVHPLGQWGLNAYY